MDMTYSTMYDLLYGLRHRSTLLWMAVTTIITIPNCLCTTSFTHCWLVTRVKGRDSGELKALLNTFREREALSSPHHHDTTLISCCVTRALSWIAPAPDKGVVIVLWGCCQKRCLFTVCPRSLSTVVRPWREKASVVDGAPVPEHMDLLSRKLCWALPFISVYLRSSPHFQWHHRRESETQWPSFAIIRNEVL